MEHARYFIRIDDIGARTPAVERCVTAFIAARLPVSYQIIPARLTSDCAAWLSTIRDAHPGFIEFGQHGLRHEMDKNGRTLWREFGPERDLAAQSADIVAGKALLEAALGPIDLFTPPQHKYDRNTLLACAAAGHRVFSAAAYTALPYRAVYALGRQLGWSSIRHHGISAHGRWRRPAPLFDVSVCIAIDNGGEVTTPPEQLVRRAHDATRHRAPVGFMLHPEVYAETPARLDAVIKALVALGPDRFALLRAYAPPLMAPSAG